MIRLAALLALATPAWAEPQPHIAERMHYTTGVASCLSDADTPQEAEQCIGDFAAVCMETEADGYTTFGMMSCTQAETQAWDDMLNREYALLRDRAEAMDDGEFDDAYAVRVERLRDAQRAWISFRDAECALAYSEFGMGTMRQLSGSGCHLHMTAERAIELKFMFGEM